MTRIEHPSSRSSHLTLIVGLILAVVIAAGMVWWSQAQEKKIAERTHPDEIAVPSDAKLRRLLTAEQYHVTRENGTETAFRNEYWNNTRAGIYVDVITGEPLFTSVDKFDGATGRPTFTKPISKDLLVEKLDTSHDMQRTEVRTKRSDAHLGHLFLDPTSPTGQRYAVNSAAFRFIPVEMMDGEGYGKFKPLVESPPGPSATTTAK